MANQSTTGFGLRAVERLGNTPAIQGQSKYQLQTAPGVALMKMTLHLFKMLVIQVSSKTQVSLQLTTVEQAEQATQILVTQN